MQTGWGLLFDTNLTISSVPSCCNLDSAMRLLQRWCRNLRAWGLLRIAGRTLFVAWLGWIAVIDFERRDWLLFSCEAICASSSIWNLWLIITGRTIRFPLAVEDSAQRPLSIRIFLAVTAFCGISALVSWFSFGEPQYAGSFKDGLLLATVVCVTVFSTTYFLSRSLIGRRKPYL